MPSIRRLRLPITLILGLGVVLAACGSSNSANSTTTTTVSPSATLSSLEQPPSTPVSLSETGSTLLFPLFQAWAPAYTRKYPNVTITAQGTGSGTGISQAAAGAVDIGASDAYLSTAQTTKTPTLRNIPLAISAQQVNYNLPGVTGNVKLTGKVLSAIYQGQITTWNDPKITAINPGVNLPATKIVPVHRSDGSGDTFLFTQFLSKADPSGWGTKIQYGTTVAFPAVPGALGENGNGGMVTGCQATPGCVAYIGISYLGKTRSAGLGEAALQNAAGSYELPNASTISAAAAGYVSKTPPNGSISMIYGPAPTGYPIVNYEYAIVNTTQSDANKAKAIRAFLAWSIDPGFGNAATFLDPVDFQPLPGAVAKQSAKQIAAIQ
jgi:phosphate transport system substrate-binding protein